MTGAVYVDQARSYLDGLIRDESRGSGDVENAIKRIALRERLGFSSLWALRYRPPKDVYASILFKLTEAHDRMLEAQLDALEKQVAARRQAGAESRALDSAEGVLRSLGREV